MHMHARCQDRRHRCTVPCWEPTNAVLCLLTYRDQHVAREERDLGAHVQHLGFSCHSHDLAEVRVHERLGEGDGGGVGARGVRQRLDGGLINLLGVERRRRNDEAVPHLRMAAMRWDCTLLYGLHVHACLACALPICISAHTIVDTTRSNTA